MDDRWVRSSAIATMMARLFGMGMSVLATVALIGCAAVPSVSKTGDGALVTFHRSGGIAGRDDRLQIDRNGGGVLTTRAGRSQLALAPERVQRLADVLNAADFPHLPTEAWPPRKGADLFTYELSYDGYTVRTMDGAVPAAVAGPLSELSQIVADYQP